VGGPVDGVDNLRFEGVFTNDLDFNMLRRAGDVIVGRMSRAFGLATSEAENNGEAGALKSLDFVEGTGDGFPFKRFDVCFNLFHIQLS
jgi:hypothetical protein